MLCSTLAIPHHCFFSLPNSSANEPWITPPFPPCLKRPPHGFPLAAALSLSLPRHSDIPTKPKVRFLSLSSLQTSCGGLLLAESALFTFLSLLFAADSGARRGAIAFFSSLYAFCHLADLRFSFFSSAPRTKREFSGSAEPFRRRRPTLQLHPRPAPRREHRRHSSGRSFSVDGDPGSSSQASTALVAAAFSLPRALCLPSFLCWFWRIRGHARGAIAFFLLSTRFATSLTLVFRSFPQLLASSASSPAPAEPFRRRRPTLQLHPRPAPRREHRRHSSGRSFSVDGDSGSGSQASTLRQQGNFAEEHAAVALVAAKKKHSVIDKEIVKPRA